jgi:hypothetical protein
MRKSIAVFVVAAVAGGCGGKSDTVNQVASCVPGQSVACVGPTGCQGAQVCGADGLNYGACVCGTADSGAGGSAGSGGTGGSDGAAGGPISDAGGRTDVALPPGCTSQAGTLADAVVYDGTAQGSTCTAKLNPPRDGQWFSANDGSGTERAFGPAASGELGGASDCAMHAAGAGFTGWGGDVGVVLANGQQTACPYDAGAYRGLRVSLKGTAYGTQGTGYKPADNVIMLWFATVQTAPPEKGGTCQAKCGDSHGVFCSLTGMWAVCDAPFASVKQQGWGTPVAFDPTQIIMIGLSAGRYTPGPDTSWDFWVDNVTFY